MTPWIRAFALCALLSAGCSDLPAPGKTQSEIPQRVIWIVVDSLRADHLGYAGYERDTSPWLDGQAPESVVFEHAIAPSNVTRRSVTAYMSGMPYSLLHKDPGEIGLPREATTVAEAFQAAGFRTVGCTTNYFLRPEEGHNQGFDEYHTLFAQSQPYGIFDEILTLFDTAYTPSGGKEFIYVHTMDVHHPYTPPIPFAHQFTGAYARDVVRFGNIYTHDGQPVIGSLPYYAEDNIPLDEHDIGHLKALYDGTIRYTDALLPKLLAQLEFDPARDLLIITADHGEQFFEHGFWRHGASLTPEEVRVPLLMRFDGFTPRRIGQAVGLLDLFPTFSDLFGFERPEGLTGESLLPLLRGGEMPSRFIYTETPDGTGPAGAIVGDDTLYTLYTDTHYLRPEAAWPFAEELYDLAQDPGCQVNLVESHPELAAQHNARLREINPRWEPFTRQVLAEPAHSILGEDRFATAWQPPGALPQAAVEVHDGQVITVTLPKTSWTASAPIAQPGKPHLLTLRYRLESGVVAVAICDAGAPASLWAYTLRRPTDGWRTLTRRVIPESGEITLSFTVREPGVFRMEAPMLQELDAPRIPVPQEGWYAAETTPTRAWTPEEAARLEALGYLDGEAVVEAPPASPQCP
jgi:arylsulfatase A-like enzyme